MRSFLLAAAALIATPAAAAPPKLVVTISVDQFSADLFDAYRSQFSGGMARLAREGTVFRNGYQSHAATETCPGHSTILTGMRPMHTGIVANDWIDQGAARGDKDVYCAEDETAPGSTFANYKVSPVHLRVPTLGERLKAASPASRVVAVAGKDRAAVMMTGQRPDQRWYWNGKTYVTDLAGTATPRVLTSFDAALANALAQPRAPLEPTPFCLGRSKPYVVGSQTVGNNRLGRAANDAKAFRASPEIDGATLALAAGLIQEMRLGRGQATDLIAVGLSGTDYVGHTYGPGGGEMCLQLTELDRELGDFFAQLDRTGVDYAVVLTADHGGQDIPERLRDQGVTSAVRVDPALVPATMGKALGARLGIAGPVLLGGGADGDVFVDRTLPAPVRQRAMAAAIATYRQHPQVAAVFTAAELAAAPAPSGPPTGWSLLTRARASFDPRRSGDFVVLIKEHVLPVPAGASGYVATHGTPWDYDRRVPILFWRRGSAAAERAEPVETVDIAPTLAAMIGVPFRAPAMDGRCLSGAAGTSCAP
ncbi:alkaline phosphatase family protein [Sphingomonas ginkgonis]|uniref:Alkaline phosphatase n=1 Tax=Sphingomonas ginkgonis TaxID=2315330 RepID=A0A429VB16_9SPHN|nr:alkaline phosphatase family protein [Sphingomonas ginkgonis]RST31170.1 alkaline phosphatase family protein [Sphingomonas ginkgonis]